MDVSVAEYGVLLSQKMQRRKCGVVTALLAHGHPDLGNINLVQLKLELSL
jgi:hypothetical protein